MPYRALLEQLEAVSWRVGRDIVASGMSRVDSYESRAPGVSTLQAADGAVVVQGSAQTRYDVRSSKRQLSAYLQARGVAAAPLNSPDEAERDPYLPTAVGISRGARVPGTGRGRILDLTHYVAGPFATFLLAEAGYDVVKVERPEFGDPLREGAPASFAALNAEKRRITLDYSGDVGRGLLLELAERALLVVESFRGGAFRRAFPTLPVPVLSLPAVAATGPYRTFRGFASTVHALLGFTYSAGPSVTPWADFIAGARAADRALDILASGMGWRVLPQASCMRSVPLPEGFVWPATSNARRRSPEAPLGEHNDEIYTYVGLSIREIDRLYVAGVL